MIHRYNVSDERTSRTCRLKHNLAHRAAKEQREKQNTQTDINVEPEEFPERSPVLPQHGLWRRNLYTCDGKLRVHQTCHVNNLFWCLLHNRNLRNFLNDQLFLHSWIFNSVLGRHSCNDLFLKDLVVHRRMKLIERRKGTNDCRKSLNNSKGKLRGAPNV